MNHLRLSLLIFLLLPNVSLASILISEIMYDLPGSDTNREWVEFYNEGQNAVSITDYFFREADTNHKLESYQGGGSIPAGGYAVVADSPSKFLEDNPGFSGILIDSSFSLSNTGETLAIMKDDTTEDYVTYIGGSISNGDGNTLNRSGGSFTSGAPTPGFSNGSQSEVVSTPLEKNKSGNNVVVGSSKIFIEPNLYVSAGNDKNGIAGIPIIFEAVAYGDKKEPLEKAEYKWNFGDGMVLSGKNVTHAYQFPGNYIASLDVISGEYSEWDMVRINIAPALLSISGREEGERGFVEIKNDGDRDVDVSGVIIKSGWGSFSFPKGTNISSRSAVKFPNSVTGLFVGNGFYLTYENGVFIENKNVTKNVNPKQESLPVDKNASTKVATPVLEKEKVEEIPLEASVFKTGSDVADESMSGNSEERKSIWPYLLGVLAVAGMGSGVYLLERKNNNAVKSEVDDYEILDDGFDD